MRHLRVHRPLAAQAAATLTSSLPASGTGAANLPVEARNGQATLGRLRPPSSGEVAALYDLSAVASSYGARDDIAVVRFADAAPIHIGRRAAAVRARGLGELS
ncbi:hypothetical protein [Nonomuraea sp. bgisy101]|uniref:hypothetical protein n=1 Tax=Nonomuraea sp. bgisy101 TaxID=3413784 RepID=UPI003D745774